MFKSKRVKVITLLAAFIILLSPVLSGCGVNSSTSVSSAGSASMSSGSTEDSAAAQELTPYEIKWYVDAGEPQTDLQAVLTEINRQLKDSINATLNLVSVDWGNYDQKMQMVIASGEKFDLCFTSNWANNYYMNVYKGAFLPLDDLLDKYAATIQATLPQIGWDACKVGNKIYAIPNYQIWALTNEFVIMKNLADKYNFDTSKVKKLNDLTPLLEAVKNGETDVTPTGFCKGNISWGATLANNGFDEIAGRDVPGVVRLDDPECKVLNQFDTDEYKNNVYLMRDWYQKGYIRRDAGTLDKISGKIAFNTGGCYKPGGDVGQAAEYKQPVYDLPASKSYLVTSQIVSDMMAVSKTSKDPARAVMFYDQMFKDRILYNTLCLGLENKHYKVDSENKVEMIENSGYDYSSLAWEFGNQFNEKILKGQNESVWQDTLELNKSATPSPVLGFNFNPEPVKTELAKCNSVVQEYHSMLAIGIADPVIYLPEFRSKLKAAGVDKIVAEEQKQVDEWKASKVK